MKKATRYLLLAAGCAALMLAAAQTTINLSNQASGTLPCANLPALTGDATSSAGSCVTTAAKVYRAMEVPFSNDQSGTGGKGWSIDTACGTGPTATVRNGTNISTGYYQYAASQNACAQLTIPENWDSATLPWVQVNFTQAGATASQTIAFQIQIGCSTTTDDPAFAAAQAFTTTTTGATSNTPYFHTLQLNSTSMTTCAVNQVMNLKLSTTASSNGAANAEMFTIYWPVKATTAPAAN